MAQIDYLLFLEQAERHIQDIVKMKADLQEYANRPDAKEGYIEKQNTQIAKSYLFYENAMSIVEILRTENIDAYSRGKSDGYRAKEIEIESKPQKYFDKEAARLYSIDKAQKEHPDLF